MSVESTSEVMTKYFNSEHSDLSMMADDVFFTDMATGQEHHVPTAYCRCLITSITSPLMLQGKPRTRSSLTVKPS
jgi:hypothetical protein